MAPNCFLISHLASSYSLSLFTLFVLSRDREKLANVMGKITLSALDRNNGANSKDHPDIWICLTREVEGRANIPGLGSIPLL